MLAHICSSCACAKPRRREAAGALRGGSAVVGGVGQRMQSSAERGQVGAESGRGWWCARDVRHCPGEAYGEGDRRHVLAVGLQLVQHESRVGAAAAPDRRLRALVPPLKVVPAPSDPDLPQRAQDGAPAPDLGLAPGRIIPLPHARLRADKDAVEAQAVSLDLRGHLVEVLHPRRLICARTGAVR